MIKVDIYRRSDGTIVEYKMDGHANYDDPGKDIVCAGVSAVAVGAYNSIETLLGLKPENVMYKGLMHVKLQDLAVPSPEVQAQLQLILESMIVMLRTIEQSYGEFVTITEHPIKEADEHA